MTTLTAADVIVRTRCNGCQRLTTGRTRHGYCTYCQSAAASRNRPVPLGEIIEVVCRVCNVSYENLAGRGRHPRVIRAREIIVVIARELTYCSFPEIATAIGRPNHSSVIGMYRRGMDRLGVIHWPFPKLADPDFPAVYAECRRAWPSGNR